MERLNSKLYEKYNALKKRKLLNEGLRQKWEAAHKELHDAMKDRVSGLQKDKELLSEKLVDKEDELEKARQDFLEDIRSRDNEILKLKQFMADMTKKNNSTATGSVDRTLEAILENPNPIPPKRNAPQSDSNANRAQLSENATVHQSSPEEESPELECSRRHTCISGNQTKECPSTHMFYLLLQSLVQMKISVNDGTERFSVSVSHEASDLTTTTTAMLTE
ncbi:hypothetical protein U9M48_036521 [Paspalum notatum var. saurae]|uniref:Uncharacterized protein n=1 Tax=Paspalum notatum var. saurae TaxID=547442 RepID=A0AAQ3UDQ3_PASNO